MKKIMTGIPYACIGLALHLLAASATAEGKWIDVREGDARWYKLNVTGDDIISRDELSRSGKQSELLRVAVHGRECSLMVEYWSDGIPDNASYLTINGRVAGGICRGKEVKKGLALLEAERMAEEGDFKLGPVVSVIIPDDTFW